MIAGYVIERPRVVGPSFKLQSDIQRLVIDQFINGSRSFADENVLAIDYQIRHLIDYYKIERYYEMNPYSMYREIDYFIRVLRYGFDDFDFEVLVKIELSNGERQEFTLRYKTRL